jgi:hypothetical protein
MDGGASLGHGQPWGLLPKDVIWEVRLAPKALEVGECETEG